MEEGGNDAIYEVSDKVRSVQDYGYNVLPCGARMCVAVQQEDDYTKWVDEVMKAKERGETVDSDLETLAGSEEKYKSYQYMMQDAYVYFILEGAARMYEGSNLQSERIYNNDCPPGAFQK